MRAAIFNPKASKEGFAIYNKKCHELSLHPFLTEESFFNLVNRMIAILYRQIEGRPVNANFLVPSSDIDFKDIEKNSWWALSYQPIGENVELEFEKLKKWLPVFEDDRSFLIVKKYENDFLVSGFMFFGQKPEDNIRMRKGGWPPDLMGILFEKSVSVYLNNLSVTLKIGMKPFLMLRQGNIFEVQDFHDIALAAIGVSRSFVRQVDHFVENSNTRIMAFKERKEISPINRNHVIIEVQEAIARIIRHIVDFQHGGTLIFGIPSGELDAFIFQHGAIKCNLSIGSTILRTIKVDTLIPVSYPSNGEETVLDRNLALLPMLVKALENGIADLSKTDGAVIFDDSLTVIAAGAFLKVTRTASTVGGARVKSAESFVDANPDTFAIVISQDGMVRSIFPRKEK
ncbi:MAG: hypothetical protein C4519_11160 [Desulfobacteraceae bacterium]|nr:MAG: hypothetical protein C4519_11160 [Desulfobacteraceae bacterium]